MRRSAHKRLISRAAFALLGLFVTCGLAHAQAGVGSTPSIEYRFKSSYKPNLEDGTTWHTTFAQACQNAASRGQAKFGISVSVRGQSDSGCELYFTDSGNALVTGTPYTRESCPAGQELVDGECIDEEDECDATEQPSGQRFTINNRAEWDRAISGGRFQSGGHIYTVDGDIPGMWSNGKGTLWGDKTCEEVSESPTEPQPQDPENTEDADFCATTSHGDEICAIDKPESCDGFYGSINGQNTCVPKTPNIDSTNCAESSNGTKVCYDPTQWYDDDGNEVERDAEVRDANNTEGDLYGPNSPASTTSNSGSGDGGDGSNGGGTGGNGDGEGEEPCTGEDCNTVKVDEEGTPGADEFTDQMDGAWDEPFNEQQESIEDWNLPEAFPDPDFDVTLPSGDGCQQVNLAYATWSIAVPNAQGCALLTQVKQAFSWLLGFITVLYLIMLFLNAKASGD